MSRAAMLAARNDVGDYLEGALALLDGHDATATAADAERVHATAETYVQLARAAVERFEEAANA